MHSGKSFLSTNDNLQHFIVFLPLNYTNDDVMLATYVVARDGKLKSNEYTSPLNDRLADSSNASLSNA